MRTVIRSITLLLGAALLASSCGGSGANKGPNILVVSSDADVQAWNPLIAGDLPSVRAIAPMFATLYMTDPSLNVVPDLAEGMPDISTDLTTWTVHLKQGLVWSDGVPITSDDLIYTFTAMLDQNLATQAGFDFGPLQSPNQIEKKDDTTVVFHLGGTFAPFLADLVVQIVPKHVLGTVDDSKMDKDTYNVDGPKVSDGPFKFSKWIHGTSFEMVANDKYHLGRPHFDKIVFKVITDSTAATQSLINGDTLWDPEVTATTLASLQAAKNVTYFQYPGLNYYDLRLNDRAGHIFDKVETRQALVYALDKETIVKTATDGNGTAIWGDIPPASWAYDATSTPPVAQDLDKAKALLAQAGWTLNAKDGLLHRKVNGKDQAFKAQLTYRAGKPQRQKACEIVSEALKPLGIELDVVGVDFKIFYDNPNGVSIKKGTYDVAFAGWGLGIDPDDYTTLSPKEIAPEIKKTGQNWTGWKNDQASALIDKARTTLLPTTAATQSARKAIYSQLEQLYATQVPTYFFWSDNSVTAFSKKVGGVGDIKTDYWGSSNSQVFYNWYLAS
ncbi:MAG: ABC transporter substrate-binding protein [Candidatus Dormibacteria bacterium]